MLLPQAETQSADWSRPAMATGYRSESPALDQSVSTAPKPSRWQIWPLNNFVAGPDRNIHDIVLVQVWRQMVYEGKVPMVFYDGSVQTDQQWLEFIKGSNNLPVLVADAKNMVIACIAWLNGIGDGFALAHFCFFNQFHRQVGRDVLAYWESFRHNGEPIFRVLLGLTP